MNIGRLSDGTLVALFRSRWADAIYRSMSTDDGQTWTAPQPTELPNNNSSIQFVVLPGDRLALVFNQSSAADATARAGVALRRDRRRRHRRRSPRPGRTEPRRRRRTGAHRVLGRPAGADDPGHLHRRRADLADAAHLEDGDGYCLSNNSRDALNRELSYPSICADRRHTARRIHPVSPSHRIRRPRRLVGVRGHTVTEAKRAVVTGASSGIGAAVTGRLLAGGWTVTGLSRRKPSIDDDRFD